MPSFTQQVPNLREIGPVVQVRLMIASILERVLQGSGAVLPTPLTVPAMIDTGATVTVVRQDLLARLNLNPIGATRINTPSSMNVECYEYFIRIIFPNAVSVETVAIGAPL